MPTDAINVIIMSWIYEMRIRSIRRPMRLSLKIRVFVSFPSFEVSFDSGPLHFHGKYLRIVLFS